MASPDATPYIDLVLSDLDPQDIYDSAVAELQTNLPEWIPREGNTEVLLLEAMAVQVAELVYAINRLPSAVVQVLLRLNGIDYDIGAQPTVDLMFNLANSNGMTIPANTSVRLDLGNDLEPVVFTTGNEVTVAPGANTVIISATGNVYTSAANGYPAGTSVELIDSLLYVNTVVLATAVTGGRDAETDEAYFTRGTQLFSRMTNALVLPRQFVAAMLEEVYVERATALDNYNPVGDPDNNGPVGNDAGHLTLVPYGNNEVLSTTDKDALLAKISDLAMAALSIHITDPTITAVNVTADIYIEDGYLAADVITNVQATLQAYLDPMSWNWSSSVRRNDLISLITNTVGVDWVNAISVPAADVTLPGVAPLADAGTITINVL